MMASATRFVVREFQLAVLCAGILILSACQQEQPEKKIIGTWDNTHSFIMYSEDGSFSVAYSVEDLESAPLDWGTYTFDGDLLIYFGDEMGECKGLTGTFIVAFSADGEALYTRVEDACVGRDRNMTAVPWTRVSP